MIYCYPAGVIVISGSHSRHRAWVPLAVFFLYRVLSEMMAVILTSQVSSWRISVQYVM